MKFEIDIELPEEVLREWEPVAIRQAMSGDYVLSGIASDAPYVREFVGSPYCICLIFRRRFQWPAWLKCRYLVWDADGTASGWNDMPEMSSVDWYNDNDTDNKLEFVASAQHATHFGVAFPGGDWRTRIEENTNWSKTDDARRD